MATLTGFQSQVNYFMLEGLPGDIASGVNSTDLLSNGYFAKDDATIGYAAFLHATGTQVSSVRATAGAAAPIAGFITRNQGLAPFSWSNSEIGYNSVVPDGKQATVAYGGDFLAVITGVDTNAAADHVPVVGELIWVSEADGSLACAPAAVTTVTGYVRATGWTVSMIDGRTSATVGANQSFCKFTGFLQRG